MSMKRVATDLVWLILYAAYFTSRMESFRMLSQFYLSRGRKIVLDELYK